MSDSIRRVWEQQEALRRMADPFGDLRRQIDPVDDAYAQLGIWSETTHFLQQEEERRKLLSGVVGDYRRMGLDGDAIARMAEEAERHRKLLEGPVEEARRLRLLDLNSDLCRSMAAIGAQQAYKRVFRRPELDEIGRLAREGLGRGRAWAPERWPRPCSGLVAPARRLRQRWRRCAAPG